MLPSPKITRKLLTNKAYGAPPFTTRGNPRRISAIALACLHVTANPNDPPATAMQERDHANRAGSPGPSAHFYVNPDSSAVEAIDWRTFPAWSNGDVRSPKTDVPGIPDVLAIRAAGGNANEAYAIEIENCARYPGFPITAGQISTDAFLIATAALATGLPISRSTVHLHSDLNTETRPNCPVPAALAESFVGKVIALANDYLEVLTLKASLGAAYDEIGTLKLALAGAEQGRASALATIIRWEDYGREVTSRAGSILGLDRPEIPGEVME